MAYNNKLRFRDSKKDVVFRGKYGNATTGVFDYTDGGKAFGKFSDAEILAFARNHDAKTIERLMIGEIPAPVAKTVSPAPKTEK